MFDDSTIIFIFGMGQHPIILYNPKNNRKGIYLKIKITKITRANCSLFRDASNDASKYFALKGNLKKSINGLTDAWYIE